MLQTNFSQNVLKEVNAAIVVDSKESLKDYLNLLLNLLQMKLSQEAWKESMLLRSRIPVANLLSSLKNRELRERIHTTSLSRGSRGGN